MKKIIAILLIFLESLMLLGATFAQTAAPGVSVGETFDYSYLVLWSSTNPTAQTPSDYIDLNKTQTIQLRITDISGSKISIEKTQTLKSGSQTVETGSVDINTGTIQISYGSLIVGANIQANALLYPSGGNAVVSSTAFRTYPSGQRETNYLISEINDQDYYEKVEIYFDKAKGVAVNYSYESRETIDGYTSTVKETLTNINSEVWTATNPDSTAIPSHPTSTQSLFPTSGSQAPIQPSSDLVLIVVLVVVIIAVIVVALLLVRGRSRKKSRVDEEFAKYMKPKDS